MAAAAEEFIARARSEWPDFEVSEAFLAHVASHVRNIDAPVHETLASLRAGDLLLAWACASGDARAIPVFLRRYEDDVLRAARRVHAAGVGVEDIAQEFARRVLAAPSPKIAEYSGRGDLRAWVRIVASRLSLDIARLKRSDERPSAKDGGFEGVAAAADAPELAYFRRLYQTEVRAALDTAAQGLTDDERAALREHYVLGMSIDDIATARGIHRATAARRAKRARETLVAGVRKVLDERHGLAGRDLVSVMNLVRSQLNVTMDRLLG